VTGVLIIGAGIAGVTTALSLAAVGVECRVVDRVRELSAVGVGINLQPHAVRELTELGLGDRLAEHGVATAEAVHFDRFGNRIWREPRGVAAGFGWPQYSIHRGTLQTLLLAEVRERLGEDSVRVGLAFESCVETANGVSARLRTREGAEVTVDADALVGADGLYSAVRAWAHPGEGAPIGAGIRMWRGTTAGPPFLGGRTMIVAGSNSAAKFVAYPITPTVNGRTTINWVAEVRLPDDDLRADWTAPGRLADVLPHFADWRFAWLDVPKLIRGSATILEYPMVDRDPLPWWGTSRVTLAGDAAHPMYPIGSNGGSQAILDARVLAYYLATESDPVTALASYETARREPVSVIQLANRRLGPERVLRTVAERAPRGFTHIEDVLTPAELADIGAAYRNTTSTAAAELNARDSWHPDKRGRQG